MRRAILLLSVAFLLLGVFLALCGAQVIDTRTLDPKRPMKITLSQEMDTIIRFPSKINFLNGKGITENKGQQNSNTPAVVSADKQGEFLILNAIVPNAQAFIVVSCGDDDYLFALVTGPEPDAIVRLVKRDAASEMVRELTPKQVKANRPRQDDQMYIGLWHRAHNAALLREKYPDLYKGYEVRVTDRLISESDAWKTCVKTVHRFSAEDATVLEGTITNKTERPLSFDGRTVAVQVAQEVHPAKMTYCMRPVPPGATVPIVVIIQGNPDGVSRANLAISNEYRIETPAATGQLASVWDPRKKVKPMSPKSTEQTIPRQQTGNPVRDPGVASK